MSSYLFHESDAFIAPPPPELAEVNVERAMWQQFGRRPEDMTVIEYEIRLAILGAEAEQARSRRG